MRLRLAAGDINAAYFMAVKPRGTDDLLGTNNARSRPSRAFSRRKIAISRHDRRRGVPAQCPTARISIAIPFVLATDGRRGLLGLNAFRTATTCSARFASATMPVCGRPTIPLPPSRRLTERAHSGPRGRAAGHTNVLA